MVRNRLDSNAGGNSKHRNNDAIDICKSEVVLDEIGKPRVFTHEDIPRNDDGSFYTRFDHDDYATNQRSDLGYYLNVLRHLDSRLDGPIEIKVVGGFSMVLRGIKELTPDIDLQCVVPKEVEEIVSSISVSNSIPSDWINNENVLDEDSLEILDDQMWGRWEEIDLGFINITILAADVESMIERKLESVLFSFDDDIRFRKDYNDIVRFMKHTHELRFSDFVRIYCTTFGGNDKREITQKLIKEHNRRKEARSKQ